MTERPFVGVLGHQNSGKSTTWNTSGDFGGESRPNPLPPPFPSAGVRATADLRKRYIAALRAADGEVIEPLLKFVRS